MVAISGAAQTAQSVAQEGIVDTPVPGYLIVLDPNLDRADTTVTVALGSFPVLVDVEFSIDGAVLDDVVTTDSNGDVDAFSVAVPRTYGAGVHTITATAGGILGSDTFTLARDPAEFPVNQTLDTDPVYIEDALGTNGVHHWVLQDLMPGGLGSWVMPINPAAMANPHVRRTVGVAHTTTVEGQPHVNESEPVLDWEFSGFCPSKAFYDQLVAYSQLNRRFYIIDHRNRAWTVAFAELDMRPRKRTRDDAGNDNDWLHDYTAKVALYSQIPKVPVTP